MKKIVVANFKMNKTSFETLEYISSFNKLLPKNLDCQVAICLPYTSLFLGENFNKQIIIGAQNLSEHEQGSNTGEISASMLEDLNVKLVIVGHSDRRKHASETNEKINKKIKIALKHGFKVVLCVGETKAQRFAKRTKEVLKKQVESALCGIYENELGSIIVAYEPVWAVGTGTIAAISEISNAAKIIRETISSIFSSKAASNLQIVYGGSITSQSCKQIFKNKEISGALVGASSLDPKEFVKIINC